MLPRMKLLAVRILLVFIALYLLAFWAVAVPYMLSIGYLEGRQIKHVWRDIALQAEYDAGLFVWVFANPMDRDEDTL